MRIIIKQLNPNLAEPYFNRGLVYKLLKDYNKAVADLSKCIQIVPNNATAYYNRFICYQMLGEQAKADADFKKAKALGYKS